MPGGRSFKADEDFLRFVSMGAIGVRRVLADLEAQGHNPVPLERGSTDFKLWKQTRIKGMRVPDILCVNNGVRVECRAKTKFEISASHSTTRADRGWDYGLTDTDYFAIPVCRPSGERPVDWVAEELVQYLSVRELREAKESGLADLTEPKGTQQGSEIRIVWPCSVATADGEITEIAAERLLYRKRDTNRQVRLARAKKGRALEPRVRVRDAVLPNQVLLSVVPVSRTIPLEDRVDCSHYLEDVSSASESARFAAVKALSLFEEAEVGPALLERMNDPNDHIFVRLEAAASLARRENAQGWGFLETTLSDEYLERRLESVIVLAELEGQKARDLLCAVLSDPQQPADIRSGAAWALGEHRDPQVIDILSQTFAGEAEAVKIEAARALAKLAPGSEPDMLKLFAASGEHTRPGIAWALSRRGNLSVSDVLPAMVDKDARQWVSYIVGSQDPASYLSQIEVLRQHDPEVHFAVTLLWKVLTSWVFHLEEYG